MIHESEGTIRRELSLTGFHLETEAMSAWFNPLKIYCMKREKCQKWKEAFRCYTPQRTDENCLDTSRTENRV